MQTFGFTCGSLLQRIVFGVGYVSFYYKLMAHLNSLWMRCDGNVPTHNGYLEILNELGLIGFSFFVLMMLFHVRNLFIVYDIHRRQFAFHMAILLIFTISNFSESTAVTGDHIFATSFSSQ